MATGSDSTGAGGPKYPSPVTAVGVLALVAALASTYCLWATNGSNIVELPLVAAPLLALYWVARRVSDDGAVGWMVFGAGFIIVVPVVMFALVLSVSSHGGVDPDLGISFDVLMTVGPIVQLIAVALLFGFASIVRGGPRT